MGLVCGCWSWSWSWSWSWGWSWSWSWSWGWSWSECGLVSHLLSGLSERRALLPVTPADDGESGHRRSCCCFMVLPPRWLQGRRTGMESGGLLSKGLLGGGGLGWLYRRYEKGPVFRLGLSLNLVPREGLEPSRCHHRRILNPLRLPIPPPRL